MSRYKSEVDYIKSLKRVDFDPCTLSVDGYASEFKDVKEDFPDLIKVFFETINHEEYSCIANFLDLVWVTNNLKEILNYEKDLFLLCESKKAVIADTALKIFDHASCEDDIEFDYTKLLKLDIKVTYLKSYANSIAGIKK